MLRIKQDNGEIEEISLIIKFGKEEHIDSMRNGNIYTNNLKYFIDLEKDHGDIGIGDRDEATLLLNNVDLKITEVDTGKEVSLGHFMFGSSGEGVKFNNNTIRLQLDEHVKMPVLCLSGINKNELKQTDSKYILKFSEDEINHFKEEFKDYTHALIMHAGPFIERISEAADAIGTRIYCGYVSYYDPSVNQEERVDDYNSIRRAFWKKDLFKNQKEFRVAFDNKTIESGKVLINIGDISDISEKVTINELLDKNYSLTVYEMNY